MNKKIIIIFIGLFSALIIFSIFWRFWEETQTKKDIVNRSDQFVMAWANYNDSASEEYFQTIEPFTSEDIVNEYRESSEVLLEMRGNKEPSKSSFKITQGSVIKKEGEIYKIELRGIRDYSFQEDDLEQTVYMTWEKINDKYLITKVHTDK